MLNLFPVKRGVGNRRERLYIELCCSQSILRMTGDKALKSIS